MSGMKTKPRRILTHCLLRPADVQPQFERFEVIGTFNPVSYTHLTLPTMQ